MIIGGHTLRKAIEDGEIKAYRNSGGLEKQLKASELVIGSNSIDVTLGETMLCPSHPKNIVDPRDPESLTFYQQPLVETPNGQAFLILPGIVYLGYVVERFDAPSPLKYAFYYPVVQMLDGRSTVGRMGILVHVTAGFGDVGFAGNFTLEIVNLNRVPVLLYPGMRIAQVAFHAVSPPFEDIPAQAYDGAYKTNHTGRPVPPVLGPDRF